MHMKLTENNVVRRVIMNRFYCMLCTAAAVCLVAPDAVGTLVEVADTAAVSVSGDGVTASTPKYSGMPSDLPTPIFWFDCSNTDGWTIVKGQGGTNFVAQIPSLVGDGRFLTTNVTLDPDIDAPGIASHCEDALSSAR